MSKVHLHSWHRSLSAHEFDVRPFTVLFGKNNVGKTNLLEALYGVLAPDVVELKDARSARGVRDDVETSGAVLVELEQGAAFDDAVLALVPDRVNGDYGFLQFGELPPGHVFFANTPNNDSLPRKEGEAEIWFVDVGDYFNAPLEAHGLIIDEVLDEMYVVDDERTRLVGHPLRLLPVFLGWEFNDVNQWVTAEIADLTIVPDRYEYSDDGGMRLAKGKQGWLEPVDDDGESAVTWQVRPEVSEHLERLATLATELLPDFLDGSISAELPVPTQWGESPSARVSYQERIDSEGRSLHDFGRGTSRWLAIAVQVALHIMRHASTIATLSSDSYKPLSGHVVLVDEPEAHLHPSAVASVVRWCRRLVDYGVHVIAASHHEEFLRTFGDDVALVRVSRELHTWGGDDWGGLYARLNTAVRTLPIVATSTLQELADEIGMHPAAALSLHRAILFVEGTLDVAVLDEYAGMQLEAAGVTIIPIHGTKNLEGLIDGEFTARLGIKTGVLTDNTITATIFDRARKRRTYEERKLVALIKRYEAQGLTPPTLFGVDEDDLLFALPEKAIREYLQPEDQDATSVETPSKPPFPGWDQLKEECRIAEGRGPNDSVNWKLHAQNHYGLPITTPDGVRKVVRDLDLAGVELPSIRTVVDEIIRWARAEPESSS